MQQHEPTKMGMEKHTQMVCHHSQITGLQEIHTPGTASQKAFLSNR